MIVALPGVKFISYLTISWSDLGATGRYTVPPKPGQITTWTDFFCAVSFSLSFSNLPQTSFSRERQKQRTKVLHPKGNCLILSSLIFSSREQTTTPIMAATESSPVADVSATSPVEETPKSVEKTEKIAKVDKPDDDKFKKDLAEAEKQLNSFTEKMVPPTSLNHMRSISMTGA
jgi:hypothetical protein